MKYFIKNENDYNGKGERMTVKVLKAEAGDHNLKDYESVYANFDWEDVKKEFSWYYTGKVNIAYEAIDRHAENPKKKNQVALLYSAPGREEKLTFDELR